MRYLTMFLISKLCIFCVICFSELFQLCNAKAMTARHSFDVARKIAFMLWRHGKRRNGTMPTMRAALLCLLLLGAHEYPVLDRRPVSNDLELDFRWVCAVSCARKIGLDIRTHASPKVRQDQVSGGVSVLFWHAAPVAYVLWKPCTIR